MKIAVVLAADFRGLPYGGTVALVQDLLETLSERHPGDLVLVGLSMTGVASRPTRSIGGREFPFVSLATVDGTRSSIRKAMVLGILNRSSWIDEHRPDVLYAHSPEIGAALAMRFPKVPMVLHCHGTDNPLDLSRFGLARAWPSRTLYERFVIRPAIQRASRVLVNSDLARFRKFSKRCPHDRIERVTPSIARSLFASTGKARERSRWGIPDSANVAIFTGRLERPKGVDVVIRAAADVRNSVDLFELLIVGEGGARRELEALARRLCCDDGVRFLGQRSRSEIASLLRASDVFVSGSRREAISMALLEAVGSGLPAVVTDVGGARELVEDGRNGFVVAENDASTMAERMRQVLQDPRTMGEHSRSIASRYSEDRTADQIHAALAGAAGDLREGLVG